MDAEAHGRHAQPGEHARSEAARASQDGALARAAKGGGGARGGYPESVVRLIDELARLPGIGRRSAERLAFHVLKSPRDEAMGLSKAIADVKQRVRHCRVCYNLADERGAAGSAAGGDGGVGGQAGEVLCGICADASRDRSLVMVVEQPKDLISLEQTSMYRGLYHVLMGRISPLENIGPGDVTIGDLLARIEDPTRNAGGVPVREVVLALNPTMEGDGTALYLADRLARASTRGENPGVRVTRLARGLPTGLQLEYASKAVLADAIEGRKPMS